ncbi:carboxypeptidase-like regulatory domain-containing protein [Roseisolibacter agri]|uniref:carboxypeptidase-like regulatory domain-containing protein n=1 Tax=Roseisolibacter agri TaxID=2014610 RepID=UPI0024E196AF|nr:carboxypeptidase regulatory-like domain-containing protein [Roseisolibacter agri]
MSISRALRVARAVLAMVAPWAPLGAQSPPAAVPTGPGTLGGVVYDSLLTDAALPDVEVWLDGTTLTARTDRAGRFRFDSVPPGRHRVAFLHPALDAQRIGTPVATVDVTPGAHAEVRLATPAASAVHAALCPAAGETHTGLLLGLVAPPGAPGAVADVTASWVVWTIGQGGVRQAPREVAVRTGHDGAFRLCGVPTDVPLQLRAQGADGAVAVSEVAFGTRVVALALVPLPAAGAPGASPETGAPEESVPAPTHAVLRGTVRTAAGLPVAGAEVRVVDASAATVTAVTREDGGFVLRGLPPGVRNVEARAIGFRPVRTRVVLAGGRVTPVALALGADATVLATTRVTARRASAMAEGFERRLASGAGHFVTRADLERWRPTSTLEAVAMVPGVRLVPNGTGTQFGATQIAIPRALTGPLTNATCRAAIYVDGVRWIADAGQPLETLVRPAELYGIEVHTTLASIPLEYMAPDAGCGVVLLWTRRSRDR